MRDDQWIDEVRLSVTGRGWSINETFDKENNQRLALNFLIQTRLELFTVDHLDSSLSHTIFLNNQQESFWSQTWYVNTFFLLLFVWHLAGCLLLTVGELIHMAAKCWICALRASPEQFKKLISCRLYHTWCFCYCYNTTSLVRENK